MHLWEAGGSATAAASDEEAYDAALVLVALGVLTRAPRSLRAAAALLKQLDAREGRCAVCLRCPALDLHHTVTLTARLQAPAWLAVGQAPLLEGRQGWQC